MKPQGTQLSLFETRSSGGAFAVRVSARARRLTARVHVGGRVEIVVPVGVKARAVRDFVQRFTPVDRSQGGGHAMLRASPPRRCPTRIEFAYTGERFEVRVAARRRGASIALAGARSSRCARRTTDQARTQAAGMAEAARREERLAPPLCKLAHDLNYSVERVVIRCQRTRWGSCSTRGTVSLNCSLVFLRPEVVRYLFIHELAHTKHMNHSPDFWRLVQSARAGLPAPRPRAARRLADGAAVGVRDLSP